MRTAAPLPRFTLVQHDAHGAVAELAQHVAGAVVAAVVDDDDLALDAVGKLDRAHAPQDLDDGVALVEDRHDDRELAELRRGVRSRSATGALLQVPGVRALEPFAQLDLRLPAEQLLGPA